MILLFGRSFKLFFRTFSRLTVHGNPYQSDTSVKVLLRFTFRFLKNNTLLGRGCGWAWDRGWDWQPAFFNLLGFLMLSLFGA